MMKLALKGFLQNKANFRRRGAGRGQRDEGCGACTNKPNSRHYGDREIGVPGGQSCETKPIGRRGAVGGDTPVFHHSTIPIVCRSCETKPISRRCRAGRGRRGEGRRSLLPRLWGPAPSPKMSGGTPNPRSGRGQAPRRATGQSCEIKPIHSADNAGFVGGERDARPTRRADSATVRGAKLGRPIPQGAT